jgi:hypothetical protein
MDQAHSQSCEHQYCERLASPHLLLRMKDHSLSDFFFQRLAGRATLDSAQPHSLCQKLVSQAELSFQETQLLLRLYGSLNGCILV